MERKGSNGIVLPDGNLNNPSLTWLWRWCEGKAKILAVVGLPEETFRSADATVKASLVFLKRFSKDDQKAWDADGPPRRPRMTQPSKRNATSFVTHSARALFRATTRTPHAC